MSTDLLLGDLLLKTSWLVDRYEIEHTEKLRSIVYHSLLKYMQVSMIYTQLFFSIIT